MPVTAFAENTGNGPAEATDSGNNLPENKGENIPAAKGAADDGELINAAGSRADEIATMVSDIPRRDIGTLVIAKADDRTLMENEPVVANFENIYLLAYGTEQEAAQAAGRLDELGEFAEVDSEVVAAADINGETSIDTAPKPADETSNGTVTESNEEEPSEVSVTDANDNQANEIVPGESANIQDETPANASIDDAQNTDSQGQKSTTAVPRSLVDNLKSQDALQDEPLGPVRVALLDSGATDSPQIVKALSMLDDNVSDESGHAARMLKHILQAAPETEIVSIKVLDKNGHGTISEVYAGIMAAIEEDVDIINLSLTARVSENSAAIADAVEQARQEGIIVVTAAGNSNADASGFVPAGIDSVYTAGSCTREGVRSATSNFGTVIDIWAVSNFTSDAAAMLTGWLASHRNEKGEFAGLAATFADPRFFESVISPQPENNAEGAVPDEAAPTNPTNEDDEPDFITAAGINMTAANAPELRAGKSRAGGLSGIAQPTIYFNKRMKGNEDVTGSLPMKEAKVTLSKTYKSRLQFGARQWSESYGDIYGLWFNAQNKNGTYGSTSDPLAHLVWENVANGQDPSGARHAPVKYDFHFVVNSLTVKQMGFNKNWIAVIENADSVYYYPKGDEGFIDIDADQVGVEVDVTMYFTETKKTTPVAGSTIFAIDDIDIRDKVNDLNGGYYYQNNKNVFTEGVQMISGFGQTTGSARKIYIQSVFDTENATRNLLDRANLSNGWVRATQAYTGFNWPTGFVTAVDTKGARMKYRGSDCGIVIFELGRNVNPIWVKDKNSDNKPGVSDKAIIDKNIDNNGNNTDVSQTRTSTSYRTTSLSFLSKATYWVGAKTGYRVSKIEIGEDSNGAILHTWNASKTNIPKQINFSAGATSFSNNNNNNIRADRNYRIIVTTEKIPDITVTPNITKVLTGRSLSNGDFKFTMTSNSNAAGSNWMSIVSSGANANVSNKANGTIPLPTITYQYTGDNWQDSNVQRSYPVTYTYKIKEINEKKTRIGYDGKTITMTVKIKYNKNAGRLESEVTYSDSDNVSGNNQRFENTYTRTCGLEVKKVSATGTPLSGARFAVYKLPANASLSVTRTQALSGTRVSTKDSNSNGIASWPNTTFNCDGSKYAVVEISPPAGYNLNTTWVKTFQATTSTTDKHVFSFTSSSNWCSNTQKTCGVQTKKVNSSGSALSGAVFAIYKIPASMSLPVTRPEALSRGTKVATITSGSNGIAATENTAFKCDGTKYAIIEQSPPPGFTLNDTWGQSFEAATSTADKYMFNYTTSSTWCSNKFRTCGVRVKKVDASGDPLPGAVFAVYKLPTGMTTSVTRAQAIASGTKMNIMTTASNGIALLPGSTYENDDRIYAVIEESAPEGYNLNTTWVKTFTAASSTANGYVFDFTSSGNWCSNTLKTCNVRVKKVDEKNQALAGAQLALYRLPASTDLSGLTRAGLMTLVNNGTATRVGSNVTSDAQGLVNWEGLVNDGTKYAVIETDPPNGYQLNTSWIKTFTAAKSVANNYLFDFTNSSNWCMNKRTKSGVSVKKASSANTSQALQGAVFSIYKLPPGTDLSNIITYSDVQTIGSLVITMTTNANGIASLTETFSNDGSKYAVIETTPPAKFLLNTTWVKTFQPSAQDAHGNMFNFTSNSSDWCTNDPKPARGGVKVRKIDADDSTGIPNAEFTVYKLDSIPSSITRAYVLSNGTKQLSIISDPDGYAQSGKKLPAANSKYAVIETAAPNGYSINTSWVKTFTLTSDAQIVDLTSSANACADQKAPASVRIEAVKALEGQELQNDQFQFTLQGLSLSLSGIGSPKPSTPVTVTNSSSGMVAFPAIEFTSADVGYTFVYKITESPGNDFQMNYDSTPRYAKVVVTNSGSNVKATLTYSRPGASIGSTLTTANINAMDSTEPPVFTNVFVPRCGASVTKLDAVTGKGLEGAVFEITKENSSSTTAKLYAASGAEVNSLLITTNEYGVAKTPQQLKNGEPLDLALVCGETYKIREVSAPAGYAVDNTAWRTFIAGSGTSETNASVQPSFAQPAAPVVVPVLYSEATSDLERNGTTLSMKNDGSAAITARQLVEVIAAASNTTGQISAAEALDNTSNALEAGYVYTWYAMYSGDTSRSNYVLDCYSAGTANSTNVQIYQSNSTNAQKWKLTFNSTSGGWNLTPQHATGQRLDISGASLSNSSNVQIYQNNNTAAQAWRLVRNNNKCCTTCGAFKINTVLSTAGLETWCLDISGSGSSSYSNGANAGLEESTGDYFAPVCSTQISSMRTATITGSTTLGSKLTASLNTTLKGASLKYQWKRAGTAISGATSSTYTTTLSDAGKAITCTITDGFGIYPGSVTSNSITMAASYTVTFYGNGSNGGSTAAQTINWNATTALTANGFTRKYVVTYNYNGSGASNTTATATYSFKNWNTAANGSGTSYANKASVKNLASLGTTGCKLYAQWNTGSVTLPTPTRTGYAFGGWYKESACTNKIGNGGASYTPTAAITLYAKWTASKYTVTLNQQSGSGGTTSVTATYAAAMPSATMPTRTGYTFAGYYDATSGGTQYYKANGSSARTWNKASNATLYARWTANTYTVTLNKQSGTGGTSSVTATYGSAMPTATMPTRTGYTFAGYYDATSGGTQYYTAAGASARSWNKAAATTLYARWTANTYTVTLNQQSGSGGTSSVTATYAAAMPTATMPTRTGYTFGGYYDATGGSGTQYYTASGASARTWNKTAATTLYAKWTPKTVTVTYNANGGTGSDQTRTYTYDVSGQTLLNPGYTRAGYRQLGWSESSSATTASWTTTNSISNSWINAKTTRTLYAVWKVNVLTVKYHANGGTITTGTGETRHRLGSDSLVERSTDSGSTWADASTSINITTTYPNLFDVSTFGLTKTGYHVDSTSAWSTAADSGSGLDVNQAYSETSLTNPSTAYRLNGNANLTADKSMTLYANWKPNTYSISYAGMTGASYGANHPASATYDTAFTVNAPTKPGYTFTGWNVSGMDSVTHTYGSSTTTATTLSQTKATSFKNLRSTSGTVTFTATWSANTYTISYLGMDDATFGASHPTSATYDTAFTVNLPTHDDDRAFLGWYISGMDETEHVIGSRTISTDIAANVIETSFKNLRRTSGTVTFRAIWEGVIWGNGGVYPVGTFTDTPLVGAKLIKADAETSEVLAGATFQITGASGAPLYDANGNSVSSLTITTGPDGSASTPEHALMLGRTYYVSETGAPAGYTNDNTALTQFTPEASGQTYVSVYDLGTFYDRKRIGGELSKTDSETGAPLAGAVFEIQPYESGDQTLYDDTGATVSSLTVTTGEDGRASTHPSAFVPGGSYKVRESAAPERYDNDNGEWVEFTAVPQTGETLVDMGSYSDTRTKRCGAMLLKIDEMTNARLEGATFTIAPVSVNAKIYNEQNVEIQSATITTNEDGVASTHARALLPGETYEVQETSAPGGYLIDDVPRQFTVSMQKSGLFETSQAYAVFSPSDGTLYFMRSSEYNGSGTGEDGSVTSVSGEVKSGYVFGGFEDDQSPYDWNNSLYAVLVGKPDVTAQSVTHIEFIDPVAPSSGAGMFSGGTGNMTANMQDIDSLVKLDTSHMTSMAGMFSGCTALDGADLSNFDTADVTDMSDMFSGCASLGYLDLSNFNVENVADASQMFSGCSSLATVYASSSWAELGVTGTDMFDGCYSLIGTDPNWGGEYAFDAVEYGADSNMAMIATPDIAGYLTYRVPFASASAAVALNDGDIVSVGIFHNTPLTGAFLLKTDKESNDELANAAFTIVGISPDAKLFDANGIEVSSLTIVTDDGGIASTSNSALVAGETYSAQETAAPDGYEIDDTEPRVFVARAGALTEIGTFSDTHVLWTGTQVRKADEDTGTYLAGARFEIVGLDPNSELRDATGQPTDRLIIESGEDGIAATPEGALRKGQGYSIREIQAPPGYLIEDDIAHPFTAGDDTADLGVVVNRKATAQFTPIIFKDYKKLVGDGVYVPQPAESGQFSFTLFEQGVNAGELIQISSMNSGDWDGTGDFSVEFPPIEYTFEDVGTHTYAVYEEVGEPSDIIYDDAAKTITVDVTQQTVDGSTVLTVSSSTTAAQRTFVNIYVPAFDVAVTKLSAEDSSPVEGAEFSVYEIPALQDASSPTVPAVLTDRTLFDTCFQHVSQGMLEYLVPNNAVLSSTYGMTLAATIVSDSGGVAKTTSGALSSGKAYAIVETKAPAGYLLADATHTPTFCLVGDFDDSGDAMNAGQTFLDPDGMPASAGSDETFEGYTGTIGAAGVSWGEFAFENPKNPTPSGGISVEKADADTDELLDGAVFYVYDNAEFESKYEAWVNNGGNGDWEFIHEIAFDGFSDEDETIPASAYYIEPAAILGASVDGTYYSSPNELELGTAYRVVEMIAPKGYDLPAYDLTMETDLSGNWIVEPDIEDGYTNVSHEQNDLVFKNGKLPPQDGSAQIIARKYGRYGLTINAGEYQFVLRDKDGNPIGDPVSNDAEGYIRFPAMHFSEENDGDLGTHAFTVEEVIPADAEALIDGSSVTWAQATAEQKADLDLMWVKNVGTNENPKNIIYDAHVHKVLLYVMHNEAPDATELVCHVLDDPEFYNSTMLVRANMLLGGAMVYKEDAETHEPLEGAEFTAINVNDPTDVHTTISNAGGYARFPDELFVGETYIIMETAAPLGYALNTDWSVTVDILEEEMYDLTYNPCSDEVATPVLLPDTGAAGISYGLLLVFAALIAVLILRKRQDIKRVRALIK